jgi:type VI secretion system secreted protein Hcp
MALQAYIAVKGTKQGQFKGESTRATRKDKWMQVLAFQMGLHLPLDAATGQASGKRQYKPVTITKEWGAASPQGLAACASNESLSDVAVEFLKTKQDGQEYVYQTVTLTDALLVAVERFTRQQDGTLLLPPGPAETLELESWSFTFGKIEVVDIDGHTSFVDDWIVTV